MKKIISLIITLFLLTASTVLLASCDEAHEHVFSEDWVSDEKSHWHECTVESCIETSGKADHVWGDAVVITEATPDSEGVSEKKCTVCAASEESSVAFAGVSENKWQQMISASSFENYTLTVEGKMTATADGQEQPTADVKSVCKMTSDKMELSLFDPTGTSTEPDVMVFDGDIAAAQKEQYSQLFLLVLKEYDNFVYDEETKTYKIPKTVTMTDDLAGISISSTGEVQSITIPATVEIRNAEATLSSDGKLLSLVCDYTQTMNMNGSVVSTTGLTTWTFSDYGTTVIE